MKRLASLGALLAIVLAIPLSHMAFSDPPEEPPEKVTICHLPAGENPGVIIEVSVNAAAAHIEKHGDCYYPGKLDDECYCKVKPDDCARRCKNDYGRCLSTCKVDDIACQQSCRDKYERCVKSCDSGGNNCEDRCSDARDRCISRCNPADKLCRAGCDDQYHDCVLGCNSGGGGDCQSGCDADYKKCEAKCDGKISCIEICKDQYTRCSKGCAVALPPAEKK